MPRGVCVGVVSMIASSANKHQIILFCCCDSRSLELGYECFKVRMIRGNVWERDLNCFMTFQAILFLHLFIFLGLVYPFTPNSA